MKQAQKTSRRIGAGPLSYEKKKRLYGYGFIAIWLIGTVNFFIRPLVQAIQFSLGKITYLDTGYELDFVGFANYDYLLQKDPAFFQKLLPSLTQMLYQVPVIILFSLTIALVINQKFVGRTFMRSVFFIPVIVSSGVVISILNGDAVSSVMMSGQDNSTLFQVTDVSQLLVQMGLPTKVSSFLIDTTNNIFNLSWKSGIQILLFIAALQTIPRSLYEASSIEGCSKWESLWKITVPMISPIILLASVYSIIDNLSDFNNPLTAIINQRARNLDIELSAAMSLTYSLCILLIVGVVYWIIQRYTFYMNDN